MLRAYFGLWIPIKASKLKDYIRLGYEHAVCGCYILTFSIFFFTYLSKECYHKIKRLK